MHVEQVYGLLEVGITLRLLALCTVHRRKNPVRYTAVSDVAILENVPCERQCGVCVQNQRSVIQHLVTGARAPGSVQNRQAI